MKKTFFLILLFSLILTTNSFADKWQIVGARSMGMAGVGVATAQGSACQYYNPALLATINEYSDDVLLNVNTEIETSDMVLNAVDILKGLTDQYNSIIDKINYNQPLNANEVSSIVETLSSLQNLNFSEVAAVVDANVGLAAKIKKISVSIRSYGSAGLVPIIDTHNIGLNGVKIDDFSTPTSEDNQKAALIIEKTLDKYDLTSSVGTLLGLEGKTSQEIANGIVNMADASESKIQEIKEMADKFSQKIPEAEDIIKDTITGGYIKNESQVIIDAGVFTEVSLGYGLEVINGLQVGGNLKYIQGQMAQTGIMLLSDGEKYMDAIKRILKDTKASNQISFDLGAFVDISRLIGKDIILAPKFGITARNINNPYFERPDKPSEEEYTKIQWNDDKYYLGSQLRAGIAFNPIKSLTVGCDLDILKNKTFIDEFESQEIALGIEYIILNKRTFSLPVRVGVCQNIAYSSSKPEYTLGVGLNTFGFMFEIAGGASSNSATFDGYTIPATVSVALNLGYNF